MKKTLNTLDVSDIANFNDIFKGISKIKNIQPNRDLVLKEIKDADAYLASASIKIDKQFLDRASKLKVIGSPSTGVDHIDSEYCERKGISILNVPTYGENTVAEHTFALILNLSRNVPIRMQDAKS